MHKSFRACSGLMYRLQKLVLQVLPVSAETKRHAELCTLNLARQMDLQDLVIMWSYESICQSSSIAPVVCPGSVLWATGMVWMWKPAREVTICLKKTMAAPQEVRMDTIASIVSELESISVLKKRSKEWNWRLFSLENMFILLQTGFQQVFDSPPSSTGSSLLMIDDLIG